MKVILTVLILITLLLVSACKDENGDDTKTNYNVFFITPAPKKERIYIGTVKGLSSCKYIASSYYSHRLWIGKNWDYICCLRTPENECLEERKYKE